MGVASGCDEQEAGVASGSGWNLWVWLLGMVVRGIWISSYYLSLPVFFAAASLLFVHIFFKCFSFLFQYFFVIKICIKYFFTQYKHTYRQLRASHGSHMKAAHNVLCGHQLYDFKERGVDLEVEGVCYIEMHRGLCTYWTRLLKGAEISN